MSVYKQSVYEKFRLNVPVFEGKKTFFRKEIKTARALYSSEQLSQAQALKKLGYLTRSL